MEAKFSAFTFDWALVVAALSFFVSFLTFWATAKATAVSAAAAEINNLLDIIRDTEKFAEEIISENSAEIKEARLARYVNYMETLALLVNEKRFSWLVRKQVEEIIISFIVIFAKKNNILQDLLLSSAFSGSSTFAELRRFETKHKKKISRLLQGGASALPA
jgi:hypothetical protein